MSERNGLLERPSIPAPTLQLPKPVVLPNNDEMKIMSLADFTLLKVLGKGSFGKVSRGQFALLCVSKATYLYSRPSAGVFE